MGGAAKACTIKHAEALRRLERASLSAGSLDIAQLKAQECCGCLEGLSEHGKQCAGGCGAFPMKHAARAAQARLSDLAVGQGLSLQGLA